MTKKIISAIFIGLALYTTSCKIPQVTNKESVNKMPLAYINETDSNTVARLNWKEYFQDEYLATLIDTALNNNQELNIMMQEIEISRNEIRARKGEYLPFVDVLAGGGVEKVGRYTSQGANDANTEIAPGKEFPEPLGDMNLRLNMNWEIDIWRKLRNAKDASVKRYLSTIEGKNFMVTNLVAEIARSYYELLGLDNQLIIIRQNVEIQQNALETVRKQKVAGRVTELAVKKFEAEVMHSKSLQYIVMQGIVEAENRINFLIGRYPQEVLRRSEDFNNLAITPIQNGVPSQLLLYRPDIRAAEFNMQAAKLDVKVARARFLPSININAGLGLQAINPAFFIKIPESLLFNLAGDLMAPLINRNAIQAEFKSANARQIQSVFSYEQTMLNALVEVRNQIYKYDNLDKTYSTISQQVDALNESIRIASKLFLYARADYMEVLMTQRDALEAKLELVETKKSQLNTKVDIYRALGGGWSE